jgi:hypothetical protein
MTDVNQSILAASEQRLHQWLNTPALAGLVTQFGGHLPDGMHERLAYLEGFSARWDFRQGKERYDIVAPSFTDGQLAAIARAGAELGLSRRTPPSRQHYDYAVVLGGTATSCLLRTRHVARLLADGVVTCGQVVVLGADRQVSPGERAMADTYAPGAVTEHDLLEAAVKQEFGAGYGLQSQPAVAVVSVPPGEPGRRTNTHDQFEYFIRNYHPAAGQHIFISTGQIYAPFHTFGAMTDLSLPTGAVVEVVGYPIEWTKGTSALAKPHNVLQEIRSAIRAGALLAARLSR